MIAITTPMANNAIVVEKAVSWDIPKKSDIYRTGMATRMISIIPDAYELIVLTLRLFATIYMNHVAAIKRIATPTYSKEPKKPWGSNSSSETNCIP